MRRTGKFLPFLIAFALVFASCKKEWSDTAKGGTVGAGVGGAVGGAIGSKSDNTATGAILGAAIGGVTGAAIGRYMDKQERELEEEIGDKGKVKRVGEGIQVTFDSGILFDFNSADLDRESRSTIQEMASVLNDYPNTEILVEGHTDDVGSDKYNMQLSRERANSVEEYLESLGVSSSRLVTKGYGEDQPIASNETVTGRQENRRVEFAIYASDELKEDAKDGEINIGK